MIRGTLADLDPLAWVVTIHGDQDREVVAVASPVWPAGSQADRSARASREAGLPPVLRVLLGDGTSMLVHGGNTLVASRVRRAADPR